MTIIISNCDNYIGCFFFFKGNTSKKIVYIRVNNDPLNDSYFKLKYSTDLFLVYVLRLTFTKTFQMHHNQKFEISRAFKLLNSQTHQHLFLTNKKFNSPSIVDVDICEYV